MGHSFFHAADVEESDSAEEDAESPLRHFVHASHHKNHKNIHKRQQFPADTNAAAVTEYRTTISLIAQVDVNTAGSILTTQDVLASSFVPADLSTSTPVGIVSTFDGYSATVSMTEASVSSNSSTSTVSATYTPSQPILTFTPSSVVASTTFSLITVGSNSCRWR